MKKYIRIMLGKGGMYAAECLKEGYVGVDYSFDQDLSGHLPEDWREFNKEFIPVFMAKHPDKSKVAAGLACGMTHTVIKGLREGDYVFSPAGDGSFRVGEVTGPYFFKPGGVLPQRRPVRWLPTIIDKKELSPELKHAAGSIGAISDIKQYGEEIERLIAGGKAPILVVGDENVEDPVAFAMERHLEEFLVHNWAKTIFSRDFHIFRDEGGIIGEQYLTDAGTIDILAVSKDKKTLLVIELKRGRASDAVVGQMMRYLGFVQEVLAEPGQQVRGVIVALDEDPKLTLALKMAPFIDFYRYQIDFKLIKG